MGIQSSGCGDQDLGSGQVGEGRKGLEEEVEVGWRVVCVGESGGQVGWRVVCGVRLVVGSTRLVSWWEGKSLVGR